MGKMNKGNFVIEKSKMKRQICHRDETLLIVNISHHCLNPLCPHPFMSSSIYVLIHICSHSIVSSILIHSCLHPYMFLLDCILVHSCPYLSVFSSIHVLICMSLCLYQSSVYAFKCLLLIILPKLCMDKYGARKFPVFLHFCICSLPQYGPTGRRSHLTRSISFQNA